MFSSLSHRTIQFFLVGAVIGISFLVSQAQTVTGTLQGTVSDSSGAYVPGAEVNVVNSETGQSRNLKANGEGFYVVERRRSAVGHLDPGRLQVTILTRTASQESKSIVRKTSPWNSCDRQDRPVRRTVDDGSNRVRLRQHGASGDRIGRCRFDRDEED